MVRSALICVPGVLSVTVVCADAAAATLHVAISVTTSRWMKRAVRVGEHTTFTIEPASGISVLVVRLKGLTGALSTLERTSPPGADANSFAQPICEIGRAPPGCLWVAAQNLWERSRLWPLGPNWQGCCHVAPGCFCTHFSVVVGEVL